MRIRSFLLVVAVLASSSLAAEAQQAGGSALRGRVVDAQEAVLPGVAIVVTHIESGTVRETVTGPDGTYFVTGIIPGPYRITGSLEGFKQFAQEVRLQIGETATLVLTLEVGTVAESVTVTGEAPLVDLTSTQVAGNVSQSELTELLADSGVAAWS